MIARVKEGIALPFQDTPDRGWLPDGSRDQLAERPVGEEGGPAPGPGHRALRPRARPGRREEVSETCTLITTLLDDWAVPGRRGPGRRLSTRWSASETTFGENKATIAGAGNRTSGPVLRSGCPQLVLQEAWAWLTAAQLVRASEAATLRSEEAAARALRRQDARQVTAGEESFTAARHHAIRSMETTQVTATSSLAATRRRGQRRRPRAPAHPQHPRP